MPILLSINDTNNLLAIKAKRVYDDLRPKLGSQIAISIVNNSSEYTKNGQYIFYVPIETMLSNDISAKTGSIGISAYLPKK